MIGAFGRIGGRQRILPPLFLREAESMHALLWCCRIFIFLFLLVFALKNAEPVRVFFFLDTSWQAPLVIVALAFFAIGVVLGLLGLLGTVFRQRREIRRLKRDAKTAAGTKESLTPQRYGGTEIS
jgi:uncharacterized integral membrane protein